MDISISFTKRQQEALALLQEPGVEVLGFGGAKGGGKSWFLRTRQVLRRLNYPKSVGLIIRKTLPELERNHIRKIKMEWPDLAYDYKDQKHQFCFKNGSILDLMYIDTENDLDRLQGAEYDDIDIDEAEHHPKIVFTTLRSCLRTTNKAIRPTMILGFNWGNIGHAWLKRMFWRRTMMAVKPVGCEVDTWENEAHWDRGEKPEQFRFLQVFWHDNPYLDDGYKSRLEALPEELRKAWMDGDPDIFEGQFFPEFGPHLREQPFKIAVNVCNLYGSLDYGEGAGDNAGATAFLLWHLDAKGIPHLLWTYYKRNQNASVYAREIAAGIQSFHWTSGVMPKKILADPSMFIKRRMDEENSKSVADIFEEHGLKLTPANNDRINGWRVMREYFTRNANGEPKSRYWEDYNEEYELYIPSLVYSKRNASDVHKGGEDHVGDSARYFFVEAMGYTAKKIQASSVNDYAPLTPMKNQLSPLFFMMKKAS